MSEDEPQLAMAEAADLQCVEPGYRHVLRIRLLLLWGILCIVVAAFDYRALKGTALVGFPSGVLVLVALFAVIIAPGRIYQRLGYRLSGTFLQVVRGWLYRVDTVVPLVRVQHIDVTRGPLDKAFGTASLVVHTAGTHNSIVTLPGLAPDTAEAIRDVIREHVRTDFA